MQIGTSDSVVQRIPGAVKYGGKYHVGTGTWTRPAVQARGFGPDIIYNNTAQSGYFSSAGGAGGFAPGSTNYDEGGLPGTTNGHTFTIGPDRDVYRVNGFQVGYCDFGAPQTGGWEISFYESYLPCSGDMTPDATIMASGLPSNGCWVIEIDLSGGQEFDLGADGGNGWDNDPTTDSFGWSYRYAGTDGTGSAGFLLAGDPTSTDPGWMSGQLPIAGTGTYYGGPSACGVDVGTGYLTQDTWWLEDPNQPGNSQCYAFGGYQNVNGCGGPSNPYASWAFQIYADAGAPPTFGTEYCQSEVNSTGAMTVITAGGSDVAADDDVVLTGASMPVGALSFFITSQVQGFTANPGGSSGNLCLAGSVGRYVQPGQVKVSGPDGTVSLDTAMGEWSTGAIPIAVPPLSYAATAGMTTNFQLWHRDAVGGVGTSNFSGGLAVVWQ